MTIYKKSVKRKHQWLKKQTETTPKIVGEMK